MAKLPKNPRNCGLLSCIAELAVRVANQAYRMNYQAALRAVPCVKPAGKPDMVWKVKNPVSGKYELWSFSIKAGHGEVTEDIPEDYMVYIPSFDPEKPIYEQAYIFTREEWKIFLHSYPGRGAFLRYDKARGFWHIQSMYELPYVPPKGIDFPSRKGAPKASKRLFDFTQEACKKQPTLGDFMKAYGRYKDINFNERG